MTDLPTFLAARTPRTLWIELTSKCPFDCVFCSRAARRGAGAHLPFAVYTALLNALVDARRFVLNYSGESTLYPELIPAIHQARALGAFVELVSVIATAPESLLVSLSRSGLNRLTVSAHATDPEKFAEVYRHSSFTTFRARLERFIDLCRDAPQPPAVDFAFVAMDTNLAQLSSVASLARTYDVRELTIFPVMRRDEIPTQFSVELDSRGGHRTEFETRVRAAIHEAESKHPGIQFRVNNEAFSAGEGNRLGEVPISWPRELPPGALIYSCEQNPWETAHVLSNGDVVACEVLDKVPLGNLFEQSIEEIWHGERYRRFRQRYRLGEVPECRQCPWKSAYLPSPLSAEVVSARGMNAQLLYGWHGPSGESHIWSSQQAAAVLKPLPGSRTLHVSGLLPPGPESNPNHLTIRVNGVEIGRVSNPWAEIVPFGLDFAVKPDLPAPWMLEFRTTHMFRPSERGTGADQRDLGFALVLLVSKAHVDPAREAELKAQLLPLRRFVESVDRWGAMLKRSFRRGLKSADDWKPGLSIVIPERDNRQELAGCLASVQQAARQWIEPLQIIVVVNGAPSFAYDDLRREHANVQWRFYDRPLGFAGAIRAGLQSVRCDWVYLLNSDVVLDRTALLALTPYRSHAVFSLASQILLRDTTRFRDETNWSALLIHDGLATLHDWIPRSDVPVPTFYSGGGASLFRTRLLRRLLDASAYDPFYWEDVEWGWRARKSGYVSWFCPGSIAHHTRRSTISRHYAPEAVDHIIFRNGLLFQLRNFTTAGSLDRVMEEIARAPRPVGAYFLTRAARWTIARGRLWNHLAPLTDEEVFDRWNNSISNC